MSGYSRDSMSKASNSDPKRFYSWTDRNIGPFDSTPYDVVKKIIIVIVQWPHMDILVVYTDVFIPRDKNRSGVYPQSHFMLGTVYPNWTLNSGKIHNRN